MAKLYPYLLCAAVFFAAGRWAFPRQNTPESNDRIAVRLAETAAQSGQIGAENRTIFIGDSIMAGLASASLAPNSVNLALSGDTAKALSRRLDRYRFAASSRCAVIAIGINDLRRGETPQDTSAAIAQIVAALGDARQILVSEILPTSESAKPASSAVREVNDALPAICMPENHCAIVTAHDDLANADDTLANEYSADGLHLSAAGYAAWRKALSAALQEYGCTGE